MNRNNEKQVLLRLVQDIYAVRDDDIACDAAGTLMERCAEALFSDEEAQTHYPKLWRHFRFCQDCAEAYQMVMDIARLEAAGKLKVPTDIPPLPTEKRATYWAWGQIKEAITALFSGFTMQPATVRGTRSTALTFNPVEVEFDDGDVSMSFDVAANKTDSQWRDLHCWVETDDEALEERLEFAPAWLQQGAEGPVVQEQALNELGDVTFSFLSPGHYTFRLYLAGQEYVVRELVLP